MCVKICTCVHLNIQMTEGLKADKTVGSGGGQYLLNMLLWSLPSFST